MYFHECPACRSATLYCIINVLKAHASKRSLQFNSIFLRHCQMFSNVFILFHISNLCVNKDLEWHNSRHPLHTLPTKLKFKNMLYIKLETHFGILRLSLNAVWRTITVCLHLEEVLGYHHWLLSG